MTQDENARDQLFALAFEALGLKDVERTGWALSRVADPESVADHSWGTALLCLLFARAAQVDVEQAVSMALIHDLAEVKVGDIPFRSVGSEGDVTGAEKSRLEHEAIDGLVPPAGERLQRLWLRYEANDDGVAWFVRDMNLVDMCLQALYYVEHRRFSDTAEPESGSLGRAEEFLASARVRISTALGRSLLGRVEKRFDQLRRDRPGPLS